MKKTIKIIILIASFAMLSNTYAGTNAECLSHVQNLYEKVYTKIGGGVLYVQTNFLADNGNFGTFGLDFGGTVSTIMNKCNYSSYQGYTLCNAGTNETTTQCTETTTAFNINVQGGSISFQTSIPKDLNAKTQLQGSFGGGSPSSYTYCATRDQQCNVNP